MAAGFRAEEDLRGRLHARRIRPWSASARRRSATAISKLKYGSASELGLPPGAIKRAIAFGISQSGRFLRTYLYYGFNEDEAHRKVFDGVMAHVAGAGRGSFNHRFAQPSRDGHPFINFFYPTDIFPFTDEAADRPGDRRHRRAADARDQARAPAEDLLHELVVRVLGPGRVADPHHRRRHKRRAAAGQHAHLPAVGRPARRGRVPAVADDRPAAEQPARLPLGDAIAPAVDEPLDHRRWRRRPAAIRGSPTARWSPPDKLKFPEGSGRRRRDDRSAQGLSRRLRPGLLAQGHRDAGAAGIGSAFPILVPQVDADGNELAGIRVPELVGAGGHLHGLESVQRPLGADQCGVEHAGIVHPVRAGSRADRDRANDPRRSVEERYVAGRDRAGGSPALGSQPGTPYNPPPPHAGGPNPRARRVSWCCCATWSPSCGRSAWPTRPMDEHGYVMATIPATSEKPDVPVIGFIAHVDTSPEMSGAGVSRSSTALRRPRHRAARRSVRGPPRRRRSRRSPSSIGHDIVTASGTTLLGADDKAGVAEIVAAAEYLMAHPEIRTARSGSPSRPTRRSAAARITSTSRLRRGAAPTRWTAAARGELEIESFSADAMTRHVQGLQHPPGLRQGTDGQRDQAGGRLHRPAAATALSPETTDGYEGFVHPYVMEASVDRTVGAVLIRDFVTAGAAREGRRWSSWREAAVESSGRVGRDRGRGDTATCARCSIGIPGRRARARGDAPRRPRADRARRSAAAPTDRACRSWGCRRPNIFAGGELPGPRGCSDMEAGLPSPQVGDRPIGPPPSPTSSYSA